MTIHLVRRFAAAAVAACVAALLAACGDGGHGGAGTHGGPPDPLSPPAGASYNGTDVAFATDMIAHHAQALEMAALARTRAARPSVKELAARIEKAQDPEIAIMSDWLRQWGQPVPSVSPGATHGGHAGKPGMMTDRELRDLAAVTGPAFDRMFLQLMIRHHEGAVQMATTAQRQAKDQRVRDLAGRIVADQTAEIAQMRALLNPP